jgi:glycolate oxidase iron-sulfur subunit
LNQITNNDHDAQRGIMDHAIDACVRCGFCLPACPTYLVLGEEMDSPRGRISLIKGVLEGELDAAEAAPYLDRCLGCAGCVTACPSGVPYGELITTYRGQAEATRERGVLEKAQRFGILKTLQDPKLFFAGSALGQLAKPFKNILPAALRTPLELLPDGFPRPLEPLPEIIAAIGERRARVAFLAGCAQQVLAPNFNAATLRVLALNGVEVVIPKAQVCCGAAAMHTGARADALNLARQNLNAFPRDVDAIISNAAGCGSGLREYPMLLAGEIEESDARAFAPLVKDVSVFLAELGLKPIQREPKPLRIAYHDACHLAHAQGVRAEPRALLRAIPGVELLEIPEGELCCGSAGTYNLEQPEMAGLLGERKARNILGTKPDLIASGNIGCHTQIIKHVGRLESDLSKTDELNTGEVTPTYHTLEVLDLAYRGLL